jgi:hypothetical protein
VFDRDALNNEWIKAAEAYRLYEKCQRIYEDVSVKSECDHPSAKRNKDGRRDKRSECRECWNKAYAAQDKANSLHWEWSSVWDLFERIGMSVKGKVKASV